MKHARKKKRSPIAVIVGLALIVCGAALLGYLYLSQHSAASVSPVPNKEETFDASGFPDVDWAYWRKANPDVVGWLTVPGTEIDLPICQAHADDPEFYLSHDVHGSYNIYGCLYLDSECEQDGFDGLSSLVFGHHMDDGTMFSALADFSDPSVLASHQTMLLQTPNSKRILKVAAVDVVDSNTAKKALSFPTQASLGAWWTQMLKDADVVSPGATESPDRVMGFCTCSYKVWADHERTLVYTVEERRLDV